MRKVLSEGSATIGEVGNSEHMLRELGKAGASRWRGVRPTVRGVVMNPVDHPHGGGEGRTSGTVIQYLLGVCQLKASRLVRTNALTSTSYVVVTSNLYKEESPCHVLSRKVHLLTYTC